MPSCSQNGREERQLSAEARRGALVHLEYCDDCRSKVSLYRRLVQLSSSLEGSVGLSSADCPGDVDWYEVAFGLWPEFKTQQLITHAACCAYCGPRLRTAASVGEDATPEEEGFLSQLKRPSRPPQQAETSVGVDGCGRLSVWGRLLQWKVYVPVTALLVVVAMLTATRPVSPGPMGGTELAQYAVSTHEQHVRGELALQLRSDSEPRLREWLSSESPFPVALPAYKDDLGDRRAYQLEGARLVRLRGKTAALIAYRMTTGPVSLLVAPETVAVASGGIEVAFKKVSFHYTRIDGYKVVTWSVHGLTYALVSQEGNDTQASCMVCHSAMKDRDLSRTSTPLPSPMSAVEPAWQ